MKADVLVNGKRQGPPINAVPGEWTPVEATISASEFPAAVSLRFAPWWKRALAWAFNAWAGIR